MSKQYKLRTLTCMGCGTFVEKRMPEGRNYCSLSCYRSATARPQRKTGKIINCYSCGKETYKPLAQLKDKNFCSVDCHNKHQDKKIVYKCMTCQRDVLRGPGPTEAMRFCSIECRNNNDAWKVKACLAGNLAQINNKGLNKLELAGSAILESLGIEHKTQVLICDKFIVDVSIPEKNVVIQWDGDYWHAFNGITDKRQQKRVTLDKSQDAYMKAVGIKVMRFWEHEVYNNPEKVTRQILEGLNDA